MRSEQSERVRISAWVNSKHVLTAIDRNATLVSRWQGSDQLPFVANRRSGAHGGEAFSCVALPPRLARAEARDEKQRQVIAMPMMTPAAPAAAIPTPTFMPE